MNHIHKLIPLMIPLAGCGVMSGNQASGVEEHGARNDVAAQDANGAKESLSNLVANAMADAVNNATNSVAPASSGTRSVYTDALGKGCKTIETDEEGGGSVQQCPGYGGVPLYVKEGDLRLSLDAGVKTDDFATMGPFNTLGGPVEWRVGEDGRPFAIIYRLRSDDREYARTSTTIFVKSVGAPGKPGCTIAQIPGATPNANDLARTKAEQVLKNAPCIAT